ncbi:VOC family protein [Sporosarcina oncorhynchi]|uniref:VOC family protein n=1 Tax=Sporosarcina oncorhynchi TaxID=3056444 RepID=A0ABZ0L9A3_9BACL|nr:VOC family protein [Sporosarcina sp. T2O-4]
MEFHQRPYIYTGEVQLNVTDLAKLTSFYTEIIGFSILEREAQKVVLTADGYTPLLILEQSEVVLTKEPRRTGLYHLALLLPTRADLGAAIKHFSRNHIPLGASDHQVSEALYLSDPDGNGIEIYCDRESGTWHWEDNLVTMSTDPLDARAVVEESGDQEWNGLPTGTVMGHIHLHVADLQKAKGFYEALGFSVVSRYPQALFMSNGNYHHHIAVNTWNGKNAPRPSEGSAGMKAFTLIYPNEKTLQKAVGNVQEIEGDVQQVDAKVIVKDPSGNRIVLRVGK